MPDDAPERQVANLKLSLGVFRADILSAFTELMVEINALQKVLVEAEIVTQENLDKIRTETRVKSSQVVREHFHDVIDRIQKIE